MSDLHEGCQYVVQGVWVTASYGGKVCSMCTARKPVLAKEAPVKTAARPVRKNS